MFCEDQAYADFASVDRFIKSHITILAITQKLDPDFMLIWLVLKVKNIPTVYSSFEYHTSEKRQIWL